MITIDLQDDEVKPVKRKQRRERDVNRQDDRRWKNEPTTTENKQHNAGNPGLIARILKVFFKET